MATKRSMLRTALLAAAGTLAVAVQALAMPTPEETVARARQGRAEYIQVLGEVEAGTPSIADKNVLYPYINRLDELKEIGAGYDLALGSGPLTNVAFTLTRAAIKFANVSQDSVAQLVTILRWATDDVRSELGEAQHLYVLRTDEPKELLTIHYDLGQLLDALHSLRASSFAVGAFEDLQGETTTKLVALLDQLGNTDVLRFLHALRAVSGFEAFFSELERRVLASIDIPTLKLALSWNLTAETELKLQPLVPSGVAHLPGDIANETVAKLLTLNDAPDPTTAVQILDLMTEHQLVDYLQALVQATKNRIDPKQAEFLFITLREISLRLDKAGLTRDYETAMALLGRIALLRASTASPFEGEYDVQVDGIPGRLTMVDMGDSTFIMCLSLTINGTPVYYSFFNMSYNFRDDSYEALRFGIDDPRYIMPAWANWQLKFRFKSLATGLGLEGTFADTQTVHHVTGSLRSLFRQDWGEPQVTAANIAGVYEASSALVNAQSVRLTITQLGLKLGGTLRLNAGAARIELVYGYLSQDQKHFRITSSELESGRWVQLRGQVSGDRLIVGDYIVGGEGIYLDSLSFRKTENQGGVIP